MVAGRQAVRPSGCPQVTPLLPPTPNFDPAAARTLAGASVYYSLSNRVGGGMLYYRQEWWSYAPRGDGGPHPSGLRENPLGVLGNGTAVSTARGL